MYYKITVQKELAIPYWTVDRDDWEPYIVSKEILLPFLPFKGLEIFDIWREEETVQSVQYFIDDELIIAVVGKDISLDKIGRKLDLTDNKKIQKAMDELLRYYISEGWENNE